LRFASPEVEVLLLRHAPTGWNEARRRQGWADQPLTAAARSAARAWACSPPSAFAAVVTSDLQRASETARIIAATLALVDVEELPGLREQNQGTWTGLTKEQINRQWPDRLRERPRRPVGGEAAEAVLERVLVALGCVAAERGARRVLAVTHSEVIRTLERAIDVDAPPVPHLEGRWVRVAAACAQGSEPALGSVTAGELTPGRRAPAHGAAFIAKER
jgi:broad specificity phosphatase PhoE